MFEREIRFIYDFNLNKLNKLGPFFTFEQLAASDLHPAILQYISAEIDYLIFEDRQNLLKNSVFDYSGEKISYHFNQISEEVKKTKRFAVEYIAKLVLHASSFTVNYLVHPKWTLQKFVFDESQTKTTNEIKQILNYVYYYKYTNRILISYINTKKILSMNLQEFEELLNKADKLGTETYLEAILSNALKSMAEFLNIGEIKKTKISLSAVEMFLEEKELVNHLQKINEKFNKEENAKIEIADILKVLNNVMPVKEEPMQEVPEETERFETEEILPVEKETVEELIDEKEESELEEEIEKEEEQNIDEEEKHEQGLEEDLDQEEDQEHDHEKEELPEEQSYDLEEEVDEKDKSGVEISIPPSAKFRIRMDDDIKIEQVYEDDSANVKEGLIEDTEEDVEASVTNEHEEEVEEENPTFNFEEEENGVHDRLSNIIKQNDDEDEEPEIKEPDEQLVSENDINTEDVVEEKEERNFEYVDKVNEVGSISQIENDEIFKVDLAEILEHKEMTKIIEVIYDYDIEDFAKTLDEISTCRNADDANLVINEALATRRISRNSKEAESFRTIISDYFGGK